MAKTRSGITTTVLPPASEVRTIVRQRRGSLRERSVTSTPGLDKTASSAQIADLIKGLQDGTGEYLSPSPIAPAGRRLSTATATPGAIEALLQALDKTVDEVQLTLTAKIDPPSGKPANIGEGVSLLDIRIQLITKRLEQLRLNLDSDLASEQSWVELQSLITLFHEVIRAINDETLKLKELKKGDFHFDRLNNEKVVIKAWITVTAATIKHLKALLTKEDILTTCWKVVSRVLCCSRR